MELFLQLKYPGPCHWFKWMKANWGWVSGRWRESDRCWLKSRRLGSLSAPVWKRGSVPWIQMAAQKHLSKRAQTRGCLGRPASTCASQTLYGSCHSPEHLFTVCFRGIFHGILGPHPAQFSSKCVTWASLFPQMSLRREEQRSNNKYPGFHAASLPDNTPNQRS